MLGRTFYLDRLALGVSRLEERRQTSRTVQSRVFFQPEIVDFNVFSRFVRSENSRLRFGKTETLAHQVTPLV